MLDGHGITVRIADAAVADVDALWLDPDPGSKSGLSVRVIGYSHSAREVVTVILLPGPGDDCYEGINGWPTVGRQRIEYWNRKGPQ